MRVTRLKRINRSLKFYKHAYGFRKPYNVLVDGTLCITALKDKLNIADQVKSYLGDELKLITTPCVVLETEKLGPMVFGAMLIIKKFPVHKCGHGQNPLTGSACIRSMIGTDNKDRYIVATQDKELLSTLRKVPGVPTFHFVNKGPTLDEPSFASIKANKEAVSGMGVSSYETEVLDKLYKEEIGEKVVAAPKKRKRKSGPNPLSCKKKKVATPVSQPQTEKKRRPRKKKKIPKHIKEILAETQVKTTENLENRLDTCTARYTHCK